MTFWGGGEQETIYISFRTQGTLTRKKGVANESIHDLNENRVVTISMVAKQYADVCGMERLIWQVLQRKAFVHRMPVSWGVRDKVW